MAISSQKILGSTNKGGGIVLANKSTAIVSKSPLIAKRKTVKLRRPSESKKSFDFDKLIPNLKAIDKSVKFIDKTFKKIIDTNSKILSEKEKQSKLKRRKSREDDLEKQTKKEEKEGKGSGISIPKPSFLDRILNFFFWTIAGNLLFKFLTPENIEKAKGVVNTIVGVAKFIGDVFVKTVEGLVNFIDFSYEKFDQIRGFIKKVGGEGALKVFDQFSGMLNKVINGAIILAILLSKSKGFGGGRGGRGGGRGGRGGDVGITGRRAGRTRAVDPAAARRYAERYGRDAAIKRFGRDGVRSLGGKYGRSAATNLARKGAVAVLGKSGAKAGLKFLKNFISPVVNRIPIVGGLIDFALNYFVFKEPLGRSAFAAIGSTIFGALGATAGSIVPVVGNLVGATLGGLAGDLAGKWLYDTFFAKKNPVDTSDIEADIEAKRNGGKVGAYANGGNIIGEGGRTLKNDRNTESEQLLKRLYIPSPKKSEPGKDIGGEDKIKELFPEASDNTKQSPFNALLDLSKILKEIPFIGRIMGAAIDLALGQNLPSNFFKEIAQSLVSFHYTMKDSKSIPDLSSSLTRKIAKMEEGGTVDSVTEGRTLRVNIGNKSQNMMRTVQDNLERSIGTDLNKAINVIRKQLGLEPIGVGAEESGDKNGPSSSPDSYEAGPAGTSGDALTMARNLMRDLGLTSDQAAGIVGNMVAESGVENGRPQGTRPGTKGPLKVDGTTGYGIVQWTSRGRQQKLYDFAKSRGHDMSKPLTMDIEYKFFLKELRESYSSVLNQIKAAKSVKEASTIFMQQYEIPAGYRTNTKIMERYNLSRPIAEKLSRGEGKATEGPKETYNVPSVPDISLGKGYGSGGSKIAGELGRYIKSKLQSPRDFQAVTEHPEHGGIRGRHASGSYHYSGRAIDIGAYTHEQGPILNVIAQFNKTKGINPVELLHGRNEPRGHSDHVHVAYQGGGPIQTPTKDSTKYNSLQKYQNYGGGSSVLAVKTVYIKT